MLRAFVLEMEPSRFRPSLSIQNSWNGGFGIIRGLRCQGRLVEDHVLQRGRCVFGARLMRRGVWTVARHRETWQRAHPGRRIAAWVGNGNLLANPHFVACAEGVVYALAGEPLGERSYTCLAVRPGGVTIEAFRGTGFPDGLEFATFGQQVVCAGGPINREQLIAKAVAGEFADLRHLFLFPRISMGGERMGGERWMDAGLAAFYGEGGQQNTHVIEAALRGQPIEADVGQFPEPAVRRALATKGYRDYELHGDVLRFVPRPGVYPHNMIGVRPDGMLLSVGIEGLSNRSGVSIEGAGEIMAELGAEDALILDNGADVAMCRGGEMLLRGRGRLRSVLFFHGGPGLPRLERIRVRGESPAQH